MQPEPTIRDYFNAVVALVKERHLCAHKVQDAASWQFFANIKEDDPERNPKVWEATHKWLKSLHSHSFFLDPVWQKHREESSYSVPTGEMRDGIAHISLPYCGGDETQNKLYAEQGYEITKSLMDQNPLGAVVDLRKHYGGSLHPTVIALSPLLDKENKISWAEAKDNIAASISWDHQTGFFTEHNKPLHFLPSHIPGLANTSTPVALLYSNDTCSAGESTAAFIIGQPLTRSFGQATYGATSGNVGFSAPFPDFFGGGKLVLTLSNMADRNGQIYTGPIEPDVKTDTPLEDAVAWIRKRALV